MHGPTLGRQIDLEPWVHRELLRAVQNDRSGSFIRESVQQRWVRDWVPEPKHRFRMIRRWMENSEFSQFVSPIESTDGCSHPGDIL